MPEVIPSINAKNFPEVQARIAQVEPFVSWCHIDVTDGVFSQHATWQEPGDLASLQTKLNVEVHLMIMEPEKSIDQWLLPNVQRIIVHQEATDDIQGIIEKCHAKGIKIGVAVKPETDWKELWPWFEKVDLVQVLAVNPGPSGQKIGEEIFEKIRQVHEACPSCVIEVDGGITDENAGRAVSAGATLLVSASAIFSHRTISEGVTRLKHAAEHPEEQVSEF